MTFETIDEKVQINTYIYIYISLFFEGLIGYTTVNVDDVISNRNSIYVLTLPPLQ